MCGIAGYFGLDSDPGLLERMALEQRHRGPDDARILLDAPVGLAHQRLAILDRVGGAQPMTSTAGRYVLAYNGEVYNYRELRTELEALSRTFATESDTEVVLQAFAEWGPAAFDRFNGMFALAIWDRHTKTLTLARDHFGIKPLHLCRVPAGPDEGPDARDAWLFSSEIKPILASGRYEPRPNDRTIYRYLRYRIHDDGAETFFDGIERVLPGEMVTISADGIRRTMFSRLRSDLLDSTARGNGYDAAVVEEFRQRLTKSVALRLRSDVPVGTSLSGGLDSSAITVAIDRLLTDDVAATSAVGTRQRTFSAVFPGYRNDEERYVDAAVGACSHGVRSHKTRPTSAEFLEDVADFVRAQEEPVISTGPYAQYRVMKDASEYVTVMLDGQGADELLAGYVPQLVVHLRALLSSDRRSAVRELIASRDVLAHLAAAKTRTLLPRRNSTPNLLGREFCAAHATESYAVPTGNLRTRLVHDLFVGSLPALLRYEDRNTMRFSVEGRVPFLDPELVRTIFSLSDEAIIKGGWNKRVLRDATDGILPPSISRRRNKIGFTTPQSEWFREQRDFALDVFRSPSFSQRPYFDSAAVLTAFERWLDGAGDLDSMAFWRLINVELWLREFIDGVGALPVPSSVQAA
ncbi:asparagine synthase (glutamine-hydrolyzing) [Terrabacter sp. 2RAF25]|uniref:asparagine synthase (glutamine-hydrolyzing) n=1 Tax=Terrabacter sp. 2RAF25 TaxID=3232998 RepID=UPI003F96ADE8